MEDLLKVLLALIPAIGTYLVTRSNNKTAVQNKETDHSLELFNQYKDMVGSLSERVDVLKANLEESELENSLYQDEINALNNKVTKLNQNIFVLINENESLVRLNTRIERDLERMHSIEMRNHKLEERIDELKFEIELLEEELKTNNKE